MRIVSTFCAVALTLWAGASWAADPVKIPGSRVELTPPDGFTVSKDFAGLQGEKASVMVVELPGGGTYDQLVTAMGSGAMAKQGVEITANEEVKGMPFKAHTFRGHQSVQGMNVEKWILLIDGGANLAMINVSADKEAGTLNDDKVEAMFKSVKMASATAGDPVDALPFAVKPAARFTTKQTIGGMSLVLATMPPSPKNAGQPGVIISRVYEGNVPKEQQKPMMAAFAQALQGAKIDKAEDAKPIKIGEFEGYEQMATGQASGEPRKILMVMVFGDKGSYALIGMASPDKFDEALPDMRSTIQSFHVK